MSRISANCQKTCTAKSGSTDLPFPLVFPPFWRLPPPPLTRDITGPGYLPSPSLLLLSLQISPSLLSSYLRRLQQQTWKFGKEKGKQKQKQKQKDGHQAWLPSGHFLCPKSKNGHNLKPPGIIFEDPLCPMFLGIFGHNLEIEGILRKFHYVPQFLGKMRHNFNSLNNFNVNYYFLLKN